MKKLHSLFLLLVFLSASFSLSAQMTTFRFSYDVGLFDISGGMVQTPAGEFVVAGLNNSVGPYYGNAFKIDANGNVVWAKAYNAGFATNFADIKNVSTGGFIITGSSTSGGGGAILVRLDNSGNVQWAFRYQLPDKPSGNASNEYGNAVIETSDGGFLVGGGVDYFWDGVSASTVDTTSAFGFKVDASGTLQWARVWTIATTNPDEHYINDVAESADGYFFVGQSSEGSGTLSSNGDYPSNALIIKTNTSGTLTYIRRWGAGNTSSQGINSALRLSTGNILLGGFDDVNAFMVSISGTGNVTPTVIFNRRLNGSIFGNTFLLQDIMENSDGNYSMVGTQLAFLSVSFNTMIGKINSSTGAWMFGRTYAPIGLSAILPEGGLCSDQGYYVSMTDQQAGGFNYNIIRTNTSGQTNDPTSGCPGTAITPGLGTESITFTTPTNTVYSITTSTTPAMTVSTVTPTIVNQTPVRTQHCLNIPSALAATATHTNVNCFGQCTGSATASPSGGTPGYTYSWNTAPVQTGATATGLCAGNYTCTITDAASATTTVTVAITQPASALSASVPSVTNLSCNNVCNGSATASASGGTSGYSYSWNTTPVQNTATASNLCAGNYTVTVTDANSCTTTQSIAITQPSAITASATSTPSSCSGNTGTATASASGGTGSFTYSWAPSGGTNATATNLAPGSYTCTITDGNGCTQQAITTVNTTSGPTATLQSQSDVSCNGGTNGSATVNATGGAGNYTYSWSPSGGTGATANSLPAGNYTCTITDGAGCVTSQAVAITQPTALTASASSTQTGCVSSGTATVNPSGGVGSYTYSWAPSGGNSATATNLGVGTYTCTITDGNSCSTTTTATVTLGSPITVSATATSMTTCSGASTTLSASGATSYNWQPGNSSGASINVTPSTTTTYTLIGTDGTNCADTTNITITVNANPTVSASASSATICNGDSVTLTASGANTYSWQPANQSGSSITDYPATTTTYTLVGTDGNGCTDTVTTQVTVNAIPSLTASASSTTSCSGSNITLTCNGATNYTWMPGNLNGSSVNVAPTSSTTFTVIGSNAGGCSDTTTIAITVNPLPTIAVTSGNDTICSGSTATMTASGANTWSWSSGGTNASENVSPTATSTYTVTGTDANGCTSTGTFTVVVNALPTVSVSGNTTLCSGDNTTLTAAGATSYSWSTSATGTSINVAPSATTTYSVTGTDVNGCQNTSTITVTVNPPPVAGITGNTSTCIGSPVTLTGSGNGSYSWSSGGSSSSEIVTPSATTTYSLIVSVGSCADTATFTVTVNAGPTADAGADATIMSGSSATLSGSGGTSYSWSPSTGLSCTNCQSPEASPTVTTVYIVTVTDANGCSSTDSVTVYVDNGCGRDVFVPNIFSPNGDGHNETVQVYGGCWKYYSFTIYDRWGEIVFQSTDPAEEWNGSYKGKELDPAVFVYILKGTSLTGTEVDQKGNITLVK